MTAAAKTPVLFLSHGAPTFAIEPSLLGPLLRTLGTQLPEFKAVLVVSPHWQTQGVKVMRTARPETVHDFGGFPSSLYALQYPVDGAPALANEAVRMLNAAASLQRVMSDAKLGRALAPLREQRVLILACGSMTHNLHDFRQSAGQPEAYAQEFTTWAQTAVRAKGVQQLIDYRAEATHAARAHPSEDHFLPLLVAMGATTAADGVSVLQGGIDNGALSMESYVWGA